MPDQEKNPTPVADLFDDAQYAALVMNVAPLLAEAIIKAKAELLKIVEPPEYLEDGGDAYALFANLTAHKALAALNRIETNKP